MAILVDYSCAECGELREAFVASPAPDERACDACGGLSRRKFTGVGLLSGRGEPKPKARPRSRAAALCATNPDVPGLCHMSPDAGRMWVARARGDQRAIDREYARQEKKVAETGRTPTMADAVSHAHSHEGDHA